MCWDKISAVNKQTLDGGGEIPIQGFGEGGQAVGFDPEHAPRRRQIDAWILRLFRLVCFRHGVIIHFRAQV